VRFWDPRIGRRPESWRTLPISGLTHLPEWPFLVALTIGLLIGAERERRKDQGDTHRPAGVRTFTLTALLGVASASIGGGLELLAGTFVAVGALIGYARGAQSERDLTGEVALVATFTLGVLAHGRPMLALEVGVLVAGLLAYREQIHRLVRETLTEQELLDGIAFAIAAASILPMLPNHPLDRFGLFNPFTLWRLVVVVMALSAFGYIAQRLVGARFGLVVAGLASGLVSATAAVAAMAQRSRTDAQDGTASAAGAIAALLSSVCLMMVLVVTVSPNLAPRLALPLAAAAVTVLAYALLLGRRSTAGPREPAPVGRAFDFGQAILFVAIVAGFTVLSRVLAAYLGATGAIVGAAATGLADAHAAAVSMATLNNSRQIADSTATWGVLIGLSTNMIIKAPLAFSLGARAYAIRLTIGIALMLASLWSAFGVAMVFAWPGSP
jgi:uncharacterized membrane protein (DUF4010 family)